MRRLATFLLAAIALPALASAQANPKQYPQGAQRQRGEQMQQDTTRHARRTKHGTRVHGTRVHRTRTSGGEVAMRGGLSRSQVEQLQQALRSDGCDPGAADGIMGPRTRQAIACSRQKHNLTGNNTNELLRALNLDFTVNDSTGMGGMMRNGGRMRDTTMMRGMHDTTGRMRNRGRMQRDTTRPDTTQ